LRQLGENIIRDLKQLYEKVKQYPLISLLFIIALLLLIALPHWQVSGINNATEKVTQENQYRATFAQILGGVAIGIGLYYTWRRVTIAENDLKVSQEGQITERFTRAVDQLGAIDQFGNKALEIRLGGIYALERISNESEKDYWPIMEILTAYVRMNSSIDSSVNGNIQAIEPISMDIQANEFTKKENSKVRKIPLDIQAILTVIGRRKASSNFGEADRLGLQKTLDLQRTYLRKANLFMANLNAANLEEANLEGLILKELTLKTLTL